MTIVSEVPEEDGGPRRFPQGRFRAPDGACELLLVRHGQSEDAVEGQEFARFQGHADPPLSALGREQAQRLASRLVTEHIDAVYVTSLRRTVETAAPLAAVTGHVPVVEYDLREIYLGAHPDERVLVVVHGGVIGEVLAQASGSRAWAFIGADNASISHVVVTDRRWVVRRFNDTTHLDDRLTVEAAPLI